MKIIKYKFLSCEINRGTEKDPQMEPFLIDKTIRCGEEYFDTNYASAEKEAYNGEITVEEVTENVEDT